MSKSLGNLVTINYALKSTTSILLDWNKVILDINSKSDEEIQISSVSRYMGKYKHTVFWGCNYTFYSIQDIKDKYV